MDLPITMPDLATTGGALKVLRWLVEVGQAVKRGDPLLEVETDKATVVVESVASGRLKAQSVKAEEMVPVGQVIAVLDAERSAHVAPTPAPAPPTPSTPTPQPRSAPSSPPTDRPGSLFARNRAARPADEGEQS